MNVLYSSNDRYVPIVGVSIISLLENNKEIEEINIYFIDCGLKESSKEILANIVNNYGQKLEFFMLDKLVSIVPLKVPNKSYYGRFYGTQITSDDRLLYLDCDLIVNGSLKELYETELENYWIAGVQGPGASYECRQKINFPEECRYINTGVLLFNLKLWREKNVQETLVNFLNRNGEIPPYHDQNIINAVCYEHIKIVPPQYNLLWSMICCKPKHICKLNSIRNYYSDIEIMYAIKNPIIIHFSNSIYGRPWNENCKHPNKDIFEKYHQLSPWKDSELGINKISGFRKMRNWVYRIAPSLLYYWLHIFENYFIRTVLPHLPLKKTNDWVKGYMNGK